MKLLIFGNPDHDIDRLATIVGQELRGIPDVEIVTILPNDDIPISDNLWILDVVFGIDKVTLITESDLEKFTLPPRNSAHDYDLGFQLRYLTKIGQIKKINIIGLPENGNVDYDLIHSILRKLVAQDMQGS